MDTRTSGKTNSGAYWDDRIVGLYYKTGTVYLQSVNCRIPIRRYRWLCIFQICTTYLPMGFLARFWVMLHCDEIARRLHVHHCIRIIIFCLFLASSSCFTWNASRLCYARRLIWHQLASHASHSCSYCCWCHSYHSNSLTVSRTQNGHLLTWVASLRPFTKRLRQSLAVTFRPYSRIATLSGCDRHAEKYEIIEIKFYLHHKFVGSSDL